MRSRTSWSFYRPRWSIGSVVSMEVTLRQLRYFVTLAEELNFSRAAERLNVVQQSLSTAIAQLETSLGFKLFERSTRSVALTSDGALWLPHAREALAAAEQAELAAADLTTGRTGSLRVGLAATAALELTPRLLRAFAAQHPHVRLITEHYDFEDPTGGLRDASTDVAVVRPPFDTQGLDLVVIAREPRYAALSAEHPLARHGIVSFDDIIDEPWMEIDSDPIWCAFWRVSERRLAPPTVGARGRTLEDLLESARSGKAVALVPASIANSQHWPDLTFVEVSDIPGSAVAIAWRAEHQPAVVRNFVALGATRAEAPSRGVGVNQAS